jgi:hypothetical protein
MAQQPDSKPDSNETRCVYCGQDIPITRSGNVATHYQKFKAGHGNKSRQELCKGSGMGAR